MYLARALGHAVSIPIVAASLLPEQGIEGMGFVRERPLQAEIRAETDNDHALAALRDAVVGGVEHPIDHAV